MSIIEINTADYSQEEKFEALLAALKTENAVLIELAFKLQPRIQVSRENLEKFFHDICKNNKQSIIKYIVNNRPDLIDELIKFAICGGYTQIVKLFHEQNLLKSVDDEIFEKAILGKHYLTVKYLVDNGFHKVSSNDIISAASFCSVKLLRFLIEKDLELVKLHRRPLDSMRYATAIEVAANYNRIDVVTFFLENGYTCNFDIAIRYASSNNFVKLVSILMDYATEIDSESFDKSIENASNTGARQAIVNMCAYRRKNPNKFQ